MKRYALSEGEASRLDAFGKATADEMRVLYLLKERENASVEELHNLLLLDKEDVRDAIAFWRGAGAVVEAKEDAVPKKKKPIASEDRLSPYAPSEAASLIEEENLASFIAACQKSYGKVLGPTDIETLLGLHDQLGLSCEYVCLLIAHLERYDHKPMRYIEKVAFSLYDRGILSVESLAEYIEQKERTDAREGRLRKLFGIGGRALTKKEDECFLRWCEEYGFDDSVIGLAYDITVGSTEKASVAYADKILRRWFEAGCKSLPAVEEFIEKERSSRAATRPASAAKHGKKTDEEKEKMRSFDVDDMFAHALSRSYGDKKDNQ